jgi:arylformamidase
MPKIYDISVPIQSGGLVYPGNPGIDISLAQSIESGASANVSLLQFGSHTGTHVDAPRHIFNDGQGIDQLSLESLVGEATVLHFSDEVRAIGRAELEAQDIAAIPERSRERVICRTRNSGYLTQDPNFHKDFTYIAPDAAEYLVSLGVRLIGVDYLSIEQFHSGHHQTHKTLLKHDVVIVEGMNLAKVPAGQYNLYCLPLLLVGCDGAPARAILVER